MNTFKYHVIALATLLLAVMSAGGCAPTYRDYSAFVKTPRPIVTSQAYRLAPPDEILVTSRRVQEVNGIRETIRPDGKISLPLIGTIFVAGKTPGQVADIIKQRAKKYYLDVDATVRVIRFASKKIYVFGQVASPGAYPYNGANTVLGTLALAQPTRLADPAHIVVLRPSAQGKLRKRMTVNLNQMVKDGDTAHNAVLNEGDIIYVPANPLASVGLALQQLLLPIQPAVQTVRGPADIGRDATGAAPYGPNQGR